MRCYGDRTCLVKLKTWLVAKRIIVLDVVVPVMLVVIVRVSV